MITLIFTAFGLGTACCALGIVILIRSLWPMSRPDQELYHRVGTALLLMGMFCWLGLTTLIIASEEIRSPRHDAFRVEELELGELPRGWSPKVWTFRSSTKKHPDTTHL
jgi:hypothetical protein